MIVLSLEEFAPRRRSAQERIEGEIRSEVERAIDGTVNSDGYGDLMAAVSEQWSLAYQEEYGTGRVPPARFLADVLKTLKVTDKVKADEKTIDRVTVWLATAILSNSTVEAAKDDPEELLLEWVDMNDSKVRHEHAAAAGQQVPVGEDFKVGEAEMPYPGYPGVDIALWINCRCTVRPVLASEALTASGDEANDPPLGERGPLEDVLPGEREVDEPTHAGIAVQAADSGRVLMLQRTWDETDDPDVRGTWEFPGGTIEEGETPEAAAWREFTEETGLPAPDGETTNGWRSPDGIYQGFVFTVPVERDAFDEINPDQAAAEVTNPDDPDRRNPDVTAWFTIAQVQNLGPALRPEVAKMDWSVFDRHEEDDMPDDTIPDFEPTEAATPAASADLNRVPWHGVWAPEGIWSGDKRRFREGALSNRPLPLPLTWQKVSDEGHKGNVVVALADRIQVVDGEQRASGWMLQNAEADEVMGLLAEFGRFGVSVDADSAQFELDDETQGLDFYEARTSSACIVPIPAFAEAWVSLGEAPADFFPKAEGEEDECLERDDEGNCLDEKSVEEVEEALVASIAANPAFADVAPGRTEDGPGWLTHPVDTDRLRDYWVSGPGAAKIAWGTPGDFNRCRVNVAEYIKPQYLNGYCANRHYDALGIWPGREGTSAAASTNDVMSESVSLVASGGWAAPSAWFEDPKFDKVTPQTITPEGEVFGHMAQWGVCHVSWADKCVMAPKSSNNYAGFLLGGMLLDNGDTIPVGTLSIGGGHAGPRLNVQQTLAHYDSTSTAYAYVNVGEDEFGIWYHGVLKPGLSDEKIVEARASKPSGDWRRMGMQRELVACLAVNVPGFQVPRVAAAVENGEMISLVAAGMVMEEPEPQPAFDMEKFAKAVADHLTKNQENKTEMNKIAMSLIEVTD